jgi:hypothetical protein
LPFSSHPRLPVEEGKFLSIPKGNFQRKTEYFYADVCHKAAGVCTEEEVNTRFQNMNVGSQQIQGEEEEGTEEASPGA